MRYLKSEIELRNHERRQHALVPSEQAQGWPSLGLGARNKFAPRRERNRSNRSGALLLVCLSLLVLFAVMGITFVMVASQYRRGSAGEGRFERYGEDYKKLLGGAIAQVVRDVPSEANPASAIADHSLLNDFSGGEIARGQIGLITPVTLLPTSQPGQLMDLTVEQSSGLSPFAGFYNGCTLTMVSGRAGIQTSRIIGYQPGGDATRGTFRVLAFANGITPLVGDRLIVNGRPFNGGGFGYNQSTGKSDRYDQQSATAPFNPLPGALPLSLLPNHRFSTTGVAWAGADEDYDAADPENMLLATVPAQPSNSAQIMPSLHRPDLINFLAQTDSPTGPGVKYWNDTATSIVGGSPVAPLTTNGAYRQRQAMLRPHPADHVFQNTNGQPGFQFFDSGPPNADLDGNGNQTTGDVDFTGKQFDPIRGPWDVDNDGDGVMDSVWVDLGSPVFTAADGRQYKPLYAILCLDLDGRANLNAHGQFVYVDPGPDTFPATGDEPYQGTLTNTFATHVVLPSTPPLATPIEGMFADNAAGSINRPWGMGFGPAEIDLGKVLPPAQVVKLLRGDSSMGFPGRYGETMGAAAEAGITGGATAMTQIDFSTHTNNYTAVTPRSSFASPPDVWGRSVVGVDLRGQPLWAKRDWSNEVINNPYAIDLSRRNVRTTSGVAVDNPFTVAELEHVLRKYDADSASLPVRLTALAPATIARGNLLTTESADLPVTSPGLTREMVTNLTSGSPNAILVDLASNPGMSVLELLRTMMIIGRGYTSVPVHGSAQATVLNNDLAGMLSPELLSGLRFNLNVPIGNGRDDNGNGIVDEMEEASLGTPEQLIPGSSIGGYDGTVPFDHDNDGVTGGGDPDAQLVRHRIAKQLFVLAMMLRDPTYEYPTQVETALNAAQKQELTIRRLAQWAINVVDFRDSDAVMTGFEYDANPFNGWDVDGVVGNTADDAAPGPDGILGNGDDVNPNPDRRVVWGLEAPELLLTETWATHERGVADVKHDRGDAKLRDEDGMAATIDDDDLDQIVIPRGSAFFELYCTRNPNNPVYPAELYSEVGGAGSGIWALDLGRLAPADAAGNAYPVWRLAVTRCVASNGDNDVMALLQAKPESTVIEPPQTCNPADSSSMSALVGASATNLKLDRIVWFSVAAPNSHVDGPRTYWGRGGPFGILPGRYTVVGPRTVTPMGYTNTLGTPSPQVFRLNNVSMHVKTDGTSSYPLSIPDPNAAIQAPQGIVVAGGVPAATAVPWANAANTASHGAGGAPGIGFSITEPLYSSALYYDEPTEQNPNNANKVEVYGDVNLADAAKKFPDKPFDGDAAAATNNDVPLSYLSGTLDTGLKAGLKRTVFLQRLANPLRPWNPAAGHPNHDATAQVNPYITVDLMPIDVTIFNGTGRAPAANTANPWDPQDANPDPPTMPFATRQRGVPRNAPPGGSAYNGWSPLSENPPAKNALAAAGTAHHKFDLDHTLGYLNLPFHNTTAATPWLTATTTPQILPKYVGDPLRPFPWITFNNRPYVAPLEVMQVPASSPDRLNFEFSFAAAENPYGIAGNAATDYAPFRHLLNFFHDLPSSGGSAHLARLLDYLRVPSPYAGTDTLLNPSTFTGNAMGTEGLHPPFNRISNYREPGRMNVNTIPDGDIWNAVLNNHPGPTWNNMLDVMRASTTPSGGARFNANSLPTDSPTVIGNPFRNASGGLKMLLWTPGSALKEVDATLLRSTGTTTATAFPAFAPNPGYTAATDDFRNTDRNSHFRYEELQRVSNLLTTRSNVYAIWITLGYFEVRPAPSPVNPLVHPDGMQLVQELGADTGEIERHRAFYIYDRSIPVGFDRGKDLNFENGLLLKRIIE